MKNGQSGAGMMDCTFAHVHTLAISEFRKDFPLLAARLESMRAACGGADSDAGAGAAAGVPEFVTPPSNTGVNKALSLAQGSI